MFVRLLKGPQPSNILLIALFGALLWLKLFWTHNFESQEFFAPFLSAENMHINGFQLLNSLILFALIIFEAFYIVRLNVKYIFIDRRTYFPAFIYILWMTLMTGTDHFNAAAISNLFIIIAIEGILSTKTSRLNVKIVYRSGLLLGIASFFYWPAILIILPFWFIMLILHGLNWRGLFAQIMGSATPWMFVIAIWFFTNSMGSLTELSDALNAKRELPLGTDNSSIRLYIIIFLLFISVVYHYTHLIDKKIIVRKYFGGLFWFLFVIIGGVLLIPSAGQAGVTLAAIPATIFLSNQYLTSRSPVMAEINVMLLLSTTIMWLLVN